MDNKINNANTEEMKEEKAMQEIDMEDLENVAGGSGKFKGIIQTIQMSEKEKREINSLILKHFNLLSELGWVQSEMNMTDKNTERYNLLKERVSKIRSESNITGNKLADLAKKYPNCLGLELFSFQSKNLYYK